MLHKNNLITQEMEAEKAISKIRILLTFFLLIFSFIESFYLRESIIKYNLPFMIALIFSIGFYMEIKFLLKNNRFKYLQYIYKYMVIVMDLSAFGYAIYNSFIIINGKNIIGNETELMLVLSLTFLVIILLFLDIFRFSSISSYFIGFMGNIFIIFFTSLFHNINIVNISFFFKNSIYIGIISLILVSSLISANVSKVFHKLVDKSRKQEQLERFLPKEIAKEVVEGEKDIEVGGVRKRVTVLFSDIRNFTSMSEISEPEEVIDFLNSYFNDMIEIIFKYNGSIDKIIGDGIMAIFGMTNGSWNNEMMAVNTALDMLKKLESFNSIRKFQNKPPIDIGIGIHTGDVIMGNIGSLKRMEFTVIGDTVNTASRLQDYSKIANEKIIVSEEVIKSLSINYRYNALGEVILKGKKDKIKVFNIIN